MFDALNVVYDEDEKRGFIKLNLQALLLHAWRAVVPPGRLVAVAVVPVMLKLSHFGRLVEQAPVEILRWPILLGGVLLGLAVLLPLWPKPRHGGLALWAFGVALVQPSCGSSAQWVSPGTWQISAITTRPIGTLGAAIGFMTWIWLSTIVVLLGTEVNAEMEHETAQDTTQGADNSMGARGVTVAAADLLFHDLWGAAALRLRLLCCVITLRAGYGWRDVEWCAFVRPGDFGQGVPASAGGEILQGGGERVSFGLRPSAPRAPSPARGPRQCVSDQLPLKLGQSTVSHFQHP